MKFILLFGLMFSFTAMFGQQEYKIRSYGYSPGSDSAVVGLVDSLGNEKQWWMLGPYVGTKFNTMKTITVYSNSFFYFDDKKYLLKKMK